MLKPIFVLLSPHPFTGLTTIKSKVVQAPRYQLKTDSNKLLLHQFNPTALNNYRKNPEFNYTTTKPVITVWDRFWNWAWHIWNNFWSWLAELLRKLFGNASMGHNTAQTFKYVILTLAACMLVYVIAKLLGVNLLQLFKKKSTGDAIPYTESIENIHDISFDEAIESALAVRNYRLAVRLLYLRSLKQLSDHNLITWKIEKTNTDYLKELSDKEQLRQFTLVTLQFEYIWYGDFPIDAQSYQNISALFQDFKHQLS
ncbi:DUF4129 domain-containing protein [Mucilaginibacter paludis]|uniref:Protein-glutamine gamma-glutamyltransferase-like C-terminal domain-containing protein n=1 Tax=Mucilaginibacter paludis DSM 18603 TaxID=714943 RepID=H1Y4X8_9SPHI|nr:DUF4129 domain-containing protein [Mucilaginibacter paludis]EHQ28306.1 hypothetical protein Mucpa_4215 [Mucilaginibacter paludis DSM 18603]